MNEVSKINLEFKFASSMVNLRADLEESLKKVRRVHDFNRLHGQIEALDKILSYFTLLEKQ